MRTISVQRVLDASPTDVWTVLADFPNISRWNSGVNASHATGDRTEGVGAARHCDLAPIGALEETVREWEPQRRMVVSIDEARRLPMRRALVAFILEPVDTGTRVVVEYSYVPRPRLLGAITDRQLTKGFRGFIDDLELAASIGPVTT